MKRTHNIYKCVLNMKAIIRILPQNITMREEKGNATNRSLEDLGEARGYMLLQSNLKPIQIPGQLSKMSGHLIRDFLGQEDPK